MLRLWHSQARHTVPNTKERKHTMKTGYQIYVKSMNKNGTRSKKFRKAGLHNWFWNEQDAIDRLNKLVDTWKDFGFEYKIVKLG